MLTCQRKARLNSDDGYCLHQDNLSVKAGLLRGRQMILLAPALNKPNHSSNRTALLLATSVSSLLITNL